MHFNWNASSDSVSGLFDPLKCSFSLRGKSIVLMMEYFRNAKTAIGQMLASEDSNAFGNPPMGMNGGGERFEMMIPGNKVGMIIGKGGENIRNMQESTGAKIVIIQVI